MALLNKTIMICHRPLVFISRTQMVRELFNEYERVGGLNDIQWGQGGMQKHENRPYPLFMVLAG